VPTTEIVEAENPYMAAIAASERHGAGVEIAEVRSAVGRQPGKKSAAKATKPAKKRRPLSPETKAKLAQNLAKARAVRAKKLKAAKKATKRTGR
jgi:hypothetical protein